MRPPRRARARRAVTWAAAVLAASQLAVGLLAEARPRLRDPLWGDKLAKLRARLAARPGRPLVAVFGSSRTGLGFDGKLAERELAAAGVDAVAFNFGVPAAGPVAERVYLRRLMAGGVTPAVAVVEVLPSTLAADPAGPVERHWLYADRVTWAEHRELVRLGFPAGPTRRRWAGSVCLPAYHLRFQLTSRVVPSWLPWPVRFDWSRGADECGWGTTAAQQVDEAGRAAGVARARAEYQPLLAGLAPGGGAAVALRELLADCRARGVPARLVLMPEGTPFRGWYGPGADDRLVAFLSDLGREYGATLTDARGWLGDDAFYDGHHMFRAGAAAFTARLVRDVVLPAVRPSAP